MPDSDHEPKADKLSQLPVSTSLTLQALLKSVITRTGIGAPGAAHVTGLSPAARALYLAAAAHGQAPPARPGTAGTTMVVVVATDADVDEAVGDVRFFLGALEGLSDSAAEDAVLPFPSHEVDPYRGLAPHLRVLSARATALHAAATGRARVIVASATALLPRVSAPARLLAASAEIGVGRDVDPYALAELLVDAGFTRQDPVDAHGEFCVRGGVIDIFPAGSAQPVRIDFAGDTVESIRHFDPATQRSTGDAERVVIVPLREVFEEEWSKAAGGEAGGGPDASRGFVAEADADFVDVDPDQTDDDDWQWEAPEPGALSPEPGALTPEPEALSREPFFDGDRSSSLLDYVARPLVFVCEPDEIRARVEKSLEQLAGSWRDATGRGAIVPEPEKLFVPLDDVTALCELGTQIEELGIEEGGRPGAGGGETSVALGPGRKPRAESRPATLLGATLSEQRESNGREPHSPASPPSSSAGASATGCRRSGARARRARPSCSSPPRPAAPSGSSSSCATTS